MFRIAYLFRVMVLGFCICGVCVVSGSEEVMSPQAYCGSYGELLLEFCLKRCGYSYFDDSYFHNYCQVNKYCYGIMKEVADAYYLSKKSNDAITMNVQIRRICSICFHEKCDETHNRVWYRGLLEITKKNNETGLIEARQWYIPSKHLNSLVDKAARIKELDALMVQVEKKLASIIKQDTDFQVIEGKIKRKIPFLSSAEEKIETILWNRDEDNVICPDVKMSLPYFGDNGNRLFMLVKVPVVVSNEMYYLLPKMNLVTEIEYNTVEFSETIIERTVFFECNGKRYPFAILTLFPAWYRDYLDHLYKDNVVVTRNDKKTIFYYGGFYKNIPESLDIKDTLSLMFSLIEKVSDERLNRDDDLMGLLRSFYNNKKLSHIDMAKCMLCAHLAGSRNLGLVFSSVCTDLHYGRAEQVSCKDDGVKMFEEESKKHFMQSRQCHHLVKSIEKKNYERNVLINMWPFIEKKVQYTGNYYSLHGTNMSCVVEKRKNKLNVFPYIHFKEGDLCLLLQRFPFTLKNCRGPIIDATSQFDQKRGWTFLIIEERVGDMVFFGKRRTHVLAEQETLEVLPVWEEIENREYAAAYDAWYNRYKQVEAAQ